MVAGNSAQQLDSFLQRSRLAIQSVGPSPSVRTAVNHWLNLVEGFFSKMARSMLRGIRVASKDELKERILTYLDDLNRDPVVHSWTYKIDAVA